MIEQIDWHLDNIREHIRMSRFNLVEYEIRSIEDNKSCVTTRSCLDSLLLLTSAI